MIGAMVVVGLVVALWVRHRSKRRLVAGLEAGRPAYTVEPPVRRVGVRRRESL